MASRLDIWIKSSRGEGRRLCKSTPLDVRQRSHGLFVRCVLLGGLARLFLSLRLRMENHVRGTLLCLQPFLRFRKDLEVNLRRGKLKSRESSNFDLLRSVQGGQFFCWDINPADFKGDGVDPE